MSDVYSQTNHDDSLCNYAEILDPLSIYKSESTLVFTTCGENKESCFLMCNQHMSLILHDKANYDCPSESNDDFLFAELNKRYCKSYIKLYMRKICDILPFNIFNEQFF